jgi:threonine synthase
MHYISTRGCAPTLDFEAVTLAGLASDGGLYLPQAWPNFSTQEIASLRGKTYAETAVAVMRPFVAGSLSEDECVYCATKPMGIFRIPPSRR